MGTQQSPSGAMELVASNYLADASSPIDLRCLTPLAHTAQVQYQRQIKTLQALHRQAELTAESNATWRERERRREEKYAQIDTDRQALREQQAEINNRMAEMRTARQDAALRHEEAMRAAAAAKVQAVEDRVSRFKAERADHAAAERERIATVEARREATYRTNMELLEERRQELLAKERKMEEMLRQRDELRQLQAQIKAEEDYLREQQRRATKAKAEDDLEHRVATFHAKNTAKDELAAKRKKALEVSRRMRGEELRQRFEYIAAQAAEAAAVAEAERQVLAGRIGDKVARGVALAAQRSVLLAEMQSLRHQMARQEESLRSSLLHMRQSGSVALPEEVVRSLESLSMGGGPVMATAVLGGGRGPLLLEGGVMGSPRGGGGGWFSPRGGVSASADFESPGSGGRGRGRSSSARRGRTKSAGPTPRSGRAVSPPDTAGRCYPSGTSSPRVQSAVAGKTRKRLVETRPYSASPGVRRSPGGATPADATPTTPTRNDPAAGAVSSPTPYAPYTFPSAAAAGTHRTMGRQLTVEEQVAAATSTSQRAAEAAASGQYTGVHEVGRPGSRREEELRTVLQEEIAKESERQAMLAKVTDEGERARLVKYFTLEREEAKRRILALSNVAQAVLYN